MKDQEFLDRVFYNLNHDITQAISSNTNDYHSYEAFWEGFFMAVKLTKGIVLERELSRWYQGQAYAQFSAPNMYWYGQFRLQCKEMNDQEKIHLLLQILSDFFLQCDPFGFKNSSEAPSTTTEVS
ncbi:MAG: hypothetical protein ACFB10_23920 [Salibacteraceae bacterium]